MCMRTRITQKWLLYVRSGMRKNKLVRSFIGENDSIEGSIYKLGTPPVLMGPTPNQVRCAGLCDGRLPGALQSRCLSRMQSFSKNIFADRSTLK